MTMQDEVSVRKGHLRVIYKGPIYPHWNIESDFGDKRLVEAFGQKVLARLFFLPPHDPQFKRNRERIVRDAEREGILLEWVINSSEITETDL